MYFVSWWEGRVEVVNNEDEIRVIVYFLGLKNEMFIVVILLFGVVMFDCNKGCSNFW